MRFVVIGGSDAGVSAALRAHELNPSAQITVVLADAFPNYSICGLPFYVSGETPDWRQLAHRTNNFEVSSCYRTILRKASIRRRRRFPSLIKAR